jgi:sugar lactone lactonase YvrE
MKKITKAIYTAFAVLSLPIGGVTANCAINDLFASVNGSGFNRGGSIYEYTPTGVQSLFASALSEPRGMAFDRFGNLFVANNRFDPVSQAFQGTIIKITPDGAQSEFATVPGNVFLEGAVFDGAGNLFVMAIDNTDPDLASTIYKITPGGVLSTFGSLPSQSFGLAFDRAGNLFAADFSGPTIYRFTADGARSVFAGPSAFHPDCCGPLDLAFDRFGNLFASESAGTGFPNGLDRILKFTPDGVETEFATQLYAPRGLTFDRSGNLFVAQHVFDASGEILEFTPNGNETVFASAINGPQFLTVQLVPAVPPHPTPTPRPTPPHYPTGHARPTLQR